jgi:hypothetical protein
MTASWANDFVAWQQIHVKRMNLKNVIRAQTCMCCAKAKKVRLFYHNFIAAKG